jgi:hypothetical protein
VTADRRPLTATLGGLAAGAAGTGAMTAAQTAYMDATGGEPSTTPAEVAKRIIRGVFAREVSDERTEQLNNAMHWLYGTSWGAAYAIAAGGRRPRAIRSGLLFGAAVWAVSLVQLPAMKLAPPVWEQEPSAIAPDLGFHLVYGLGVATAFKAVER